MNQRKAGAILSYVSMGLHSVIALVYVPMLLYYLTKEQFGIYQLIGAMLSYLYIMDFGLSNTTTRYFAQALALRDVARQKNIIAVSHTLYTGIGFLVALIGMVFYFFIPLIYSATLSPADIHTAQQVCLILLLNLTVFIPSRIFTAVINAYERFIFIRIVSILQICLNPLLVWGVLVWKASVINLVIVQTCSVFAGIFVQYLYCKMKLHLSFPLIFKTSPLFKELTTFSFFVFWSSLMEQVFNRMGPLILGAVVGVLAVSNYSIALQISNFAICLPLAMSTVFLPKLSASLAQEKNLSQSNDLFCKLGRLQFMMFALIIMGFAFLGKTFLLLWIGPGYEVVYWIVLIFCSGYLVDVSQNVGISILQALNKHAFRAYVHTVMAVINIGLTIVLSKYFQEIGCVIATVVLVLVGSIVMNWYYWKLGIDIRRFFKNLGKLLFPILGIGAIVYVLFQIWPVQTSWVNFTLHGTAVTIVYIGLMWLFACNSYEKNLVIRPLYACMEPVKAHFKKECYQRGSAKDVQ